MLSIKSPVIMSDVAARVVGSTLSGRSRTGSRSPIMVGPATAG
jgi:hypothetical protein